MQELMSKHKAHHLAPRDCLKTTLFHKWQRMIAPTPGKQGTFVCKAGTPMVEGKIGNPNKILKKKIILVSFDNGRTIESVHRNVELLFLYNVVCLLLCSTERICVNTRYT